MSVLVAVERHHLCRNRWPGLVVIIRWLERAQGHRLRYSASSAAKAGEVSYTIQSTRCSTFDGEVHVPRELTARECRISSFSAYVRLRSFEVAPNNAWNDLKGVLLTYSSSEVGERADET
jgi:hypothetical protein